MVGEPCVQLLVVGIVCCVVIWVFKEAFAFSAWAPASDFGGGCSGVIANAIWVLLLLAALGALVYLVFDRLLLLDW